MQKKYRSVQQNAFKLKALRSLSLAQSPSLRSVCTVDCQNRATLTAARPALVHCLRQFPAVCLQVGPTTFCSSASRRKEQGIKFWLGFSVMMIVLNQFLPLALSRLTLGHLLKKVNIPARNLPVPAKGLYVTRRLWKMFRLPLRAPNLKDTKSSAVNVICQACTGFCSRCERQNFN